MVDNRQVNEDFVVGFALLPQVTVKYKTSASSEGDIDKKTGKRSGGKNFGEFQASMAYTDSFAKVATGTNASASISFFSPPSYIPSTACLQSGTIFTIDGIDWRHTSDSTDSSGSIITFVAGRIDG